MFTGLVEATGTLVSRTRRGPGYRLTIAGRLGELVLGESVAVDGVCLTAAALGRERFEADVSAETAERSTLGRRVIGGAVNLERALRLGDRLGGHLVSGHVDAVAVVEQISRLGEASRVGLTVPAELDPFLAEKGSVALDGVSLTITAAAAGRVEVVVVPHSLAQTTLRQLAPGREMNLEVDLLARYVVRYLRATGSGSGAGPGPSGAVEDPEGHATDPLARALERAGIL